MTWRDRKGNAVESQYRGRVTLANGLPAWTRDSDGSAERRDREDGLDPKDDSAVRSNRPKPSLKVVNNG